mmetsp:Transcript_84585/g.152553  ORF Transcript_84585/g.152553 Transcript_84585/m.152553 type:complete len:266 (-) Transcript_84585:1119-1916(-)
MYDIPQANLPRHPLGKDLLSRLKSEEPYGVAGQLPAFRLHQWPQSLNLIEECYVLLEVRALTVEVGLEVPSSNDVDLRVLNCLEGGLPESVVNQGQLSETVARAKLSHNLRILCPAKHIRIHPLQTAVAATLLTNENLYIWTLLVIQAAACDGAPMLGITCHCRAHSVWRLYLPLALCLPRVSSFQTQQNHTVSNLICYCLRAGISACAAPIRSCILARRLRKAYLQVVSEVPPCSTSDSWAILSRRALRFIRLGLWAPVLFDHH